MTELTLEQITALIFEKEEKMRELCFHKNRSLAVERWNDYRAEINYLRAKAQSML